MILHHIRAFFIQNIHVFFHCSGVISCCVSTPLVSLSERVKTKKERKWSVVEEKGRMRCGLQEEVRAVKKNG